MLILVNGAVRSGKSVWAEHLAHQSGLPVTYLATAMPDPSDADWTARLQAHRDRRPAHWQTQEVPLHLVEALMGEGPPQCLLVDALGTWVANRLPWPWETWQEEVGRLVAVSRASAHTIIMVAEETGWGVVPPYESGRTFRDRLGNLSRGLGRVADRVYLVVAGHVLDLRLLGTPLPEFL
ncbi:MAG: bifunctional adenosylcobinamide kinase/adenosylcobinamide-phosphate guanylyltransferase [Oscillatoriales cyanobacterium SM2_1_8]|nr:bifunctional adenosylcobinamide kinase/adenosylcobinamide-phosphate guanylyltransferase [Oscillatoriales cyanobacterium SM2_1_8]